ncbi:sll0787 family AIR synthase-like protein [Leptolyngbya sp. FACHB-671]|uniref:sll0787 family AIR synthase-like protein n=1 Tax=Leptolyngbya sp. FACHB-671 TaxID=2692812 RepID=UPI001687BD83|nr:sll0787 family AIR synthase-like protein [Cyanobacteria bacterium FACHB-471]MBD2066818.1 sll0787 family AIR synthase-like protein [Leptolyngbya sp. FACHB-671]
MKLIELVTTLRQSIGVLQKQDIQLAAKYLKQFSPSLPIPNPQSPNSLIGDDCAAIPDQDGYLLLAAEGMWDVLVESEPWFAGWCAVMVNVSDIYAMGGRPIAVVDTLWGTSATVIEAVWSGMTAASKAYSVPIVGGHSNYHSPYNALSVAILGRATHLLSSFNAKPGDTLLLAIDLRGKAHPKYPFWNAATSGASSRLRENLELLPKLAETGLCDAAKDVSMGGMIGTLLMLLETSRCGAVVDLEAIAPPPDLTLEKWLLCFPSYGFLLSVRPEHVAAVQTCFREKELSCEAIAQITDSQQLILTYKSETEIFWDLTQENLTGFAPI